VTFRTVVLLALAALPAASGLLAVACAERTAPTDRPSAVASGPVPDFRTTPDPDSGFTRAEKRYFDDLDTAFARIIPVFRRDASLVVTPDPSDAQIELLRRDSDKILRLGETWGRRPAPGKQLRLVRRLWVKSLSQTGRGLLHYAAWMASGNEQDRAVATVLISEGTLARQNMVSEIQRLADRYQPSGP
jgi:hypothetical protein